MEGGGRRVVVVLGEWGGEMAMGDIVTLLDRRVTVQVSIDIEMSRVDGCNAIVVEDFTQRRKERKRWW